MSLGFRRLNGLVLFAERRNLVSGRVTITFQLASTTSRSCCVTRAVGSGVKRVLMNGYAVRWPGRTPWRHSPCSISSGTFVEQGRLAVGLELRPYHYSPSLIEDK